MSKSIRETLSQARQLIEQDGWTQGNYTKGLKHCLVDALSTANGHVLDDKEEAFLPHAVLESFSKLIPDPGFTAHTVDSLVRWNDRVAQSAEDVILLLKQAEEMCGDE